MSVSLSQLSPPAPVVPSPVVPVAGCGVPAVPVTAATPVAVTSGMAKGMAIGAALLTFFTIFSVIWIILFSFRPTFVRCIQKGETKPEDDAPADPARCFVAAIVISLIILILLWILKACR